MSTTFSALEQLEQQSANTQSSPQTAPASSLSPLEQLEQMAAKPQAPAANPEDAASNIRQSMVSGMTGMPTPNMTDADKASFERGKAAGAFSVPLVAGATLAATAAPEVVPRVVDKAKAVYQSAKANPIKATAVETIAGEMGIDPFQLMHKAVKYGQNLFGEVYATVQTILDLPFQNEKVECPLPSPPPAEDRGVLWYVPRSQKSIAQFATSLSLLKPLKPML
jgi:hypothetical protein